MCLNEVDLGAEAGSNSQNYVFIPQPEASSGSSLFLDSLNHLNEFGTYVH